MLSIPAELFSIVWLFFLGATLGSFLNVVVYRLPRGITLLGRSHCPFCCQEIAFHDNIPVLGWLWLRGRCRTCQLKISRRYPLVEFIVGSTVLLVGVAYVALAGATIPNVPVPQFSGFAWQLFEPRAELLLLYCGHAIILTMVLGAALINMDGHRVPVFLLVVISIASIAFAYTGPALPDGVVDAIGNVGSGRAAGIWLPLAGMGVGWLFGILLESANVAVAREALRFEVRAVLVWALVGLGLGYHAMLSIAIIATLLFFLRQVSPLSRIGLIESTAGLLFTAWCIHVATWFALARLPAWPWHGQPWEYSLVWLIAATSVLLAVRWRAYASNDCTGLPSL